MFADVTILWEWEYDEDFVRILDQACGQFGLQSYLIHPFHLPEVEKALEKGEFSSRFFYDRASDSNPAFSPLVNQLSEMGAIPLNVPDRLESALDKSVMHQRLMENGIHVPYTIVLTPIRDWTKIKIGELIRLGEPFIIKPALGGGGDGVEANAKTLFDIVKAREGKKKEKLLLQEKVLPIHFGERMAWFRVYYVCGEILSCWWNDQTHVYYPLTSNEETVYGLARLKSLALQIAEITELDFFSTEIALVDRETFLVVDYVNDQCDMRLKSKCADGVPDDIVREIAFHIANHFQKQIDSMPRSIRLADDPSNSYDSNRNV